MIVLGQRQEGGGERPVDARARPQIYWAGCAGGGGWGERLDKALLKVLGFPVMFWMVDIEVRKHPRSGAARDGNLRATVQAGAKTGAGVTNPEENSRVTNWDTLLSPSWRVESQFKMPLMLKGNYLKQTGREH